MTTLEFQVFDTPDALPAPALTLFEAAPDLFGSLPWWRTVLACAMPDGSAARFLLVLADRPVALFPLRQDASGSIASLTTPYTCLYRPLLAPDLPAAVVDSVFAAFARYCRGRAASVLDAMPEDWPALPACLAAARRAGLVPLRYAHFGNWFEDVSGLGWRGYLAARPGALRETIRRKLRRAEHRSDSAFQVITGGRALEAGIAAFEQVYARSWKEKEPFPAFNAALMRETAAAGLLRLGLWRIGGAPVAAQLWVLEHGTATVLKLAHDEVLQSESPGTVLTAYMLRRLLDEEQVEQIDFGRGDDGYKQGWAARRRQRIGLMLVDPRRPSGLIILARHALGRVRRSLRPAERGARDSGANAAAGASA